MNLMIVQKQWNVFNIWKEFSIHVISSLNLSAGDEIGVHDCNENTVKKNANFSTDL